MPHYCGIVKDYAFMILISTENNREEEILKKKGKWNKITVQKRSHLMKRLGDSFKLY